MSGKILHKRSLTGGSVPTTSSLDNGELAINVNDGKIYLRRSGSGNDDIVPVVVANTVTTGSITLVGNQTITGSLTVTNNFTVLGSASITYISESTLNIGTNLITVNTNTPSVRFGGLAVIDSGSSPLTSASFLYDSVQDEFIFVHRGDGVNITSSHFVLGPETYNDQGNEIYLTANRIPKGVGNEHLNDSNISDNGSLVTINSNTTITGSTTSTLGFTGSLFGTSSWAVSASQAITASFVQTAQTASYVLNAVSSSFASTASYVDPLIQDVQLTGSLLINSGSLIIDSGSIIVSGGYVTTLHSSTNLENFSSAFNYAGVVLQGVPLDTFAPVALYDLVWSDNGVWYQVSNTLTPSGPDRKLGIVVVDSGGGIGDVLLEGDIVVRNSAGSFGPQIYSAGAVKVGDTIYVGELTPYPIASLANDIPGTGGILRILGHLYYVNTSTNNDFILRFNPSNDYYFIS